MKEPAGHGAELQALQAMLDQYDRAVLVPDVEGASLNLLNQFCASEAIRRTRKRVLILSTADRPDGTGFSYQKLTNRDAKRLQRLYELYEFSDRFQILSQDRRFGGLFNLLDTGLLNTEELFTALLA